MKFSEIEGNKEIKRQLIQTVLDQRVSHAQLFYGPEESDKLALAIAYAQFINCTGRKLPPPTAQRLSPDDEVDSCGICPSCVKYQKLVHPDLHFIFPISTTKKVTKNPQSKHFITEWRNFLTESNFHGGLQRWYEAMGIENKQGIINRDDCNEIITTLSYKSYESDYKVMILYMVEKLFYAAAPRILKILEEPPDKTLFILISEEPDQIIRTILSRTLMVRIPRSDVARRAPAEDESVHFLTMRDWLRHCYAARIPALLSFSTEITRGGREKQKSFLIYVLKIIGQCATVNYRGLLPPGAEGEELDFFQKFPPLIPSDKLIAFNSLFNDAIYHIERNAHGPTLFLDLSLKLVQQFKPNFVPL